MELKKAARTPLCLLGAILMFACDMPVETTLVSRTTSPDSRFDALVFTVDVGATADTAYHVAIVERGDGIPRDGSVFIADNVFYEGNLRATWEGRALRISFPSGARQFRSFSNLKIDGVDVPIVYERLKVR